MELAGASNEHPFFHPDGRAKVPAPGRAVLVWNGRDYEPAIVTEASRLMFKAETPRGSATWLYAGDLGGPWRYRVP